MNSTLLGVIIGGAIGFISGLAVALVNMVNDSIKWRREKHDRANRERAEVYASFLNSGVTVVTKITLHQHERLKEDIVVFGMEYQTVKLVASPPVRKMAENFAAVVYGIVRKRDSQDWPSISDECMNHLVASQDNFYEVVREERGTE
jgi:hypothetical protein